jgi:uncharacterized membrane protein YheB (UPF0754 family)
MGDLAIDYKTAAELGGIIVVATLHGYGAAWLAVRMLFRPHRSVKLFGMTIWPQGMIPRHRERLAQTIGNAVGNELVSQETVVHALFETDFFEKRIEGFVNAYTTDLLDTSYPSFIDLLPRAARAPLLDAVSALQYRIAEHIVGVLKNEETVTAVNGFIERRVEELLAKRMSDTVETETFEQVLNFVESRFHALVTEPVFESKVREFVGGRLDDLFQSSGTLAEMFTPETVALIKERIDNQIPPIVHQIADIATNKNTRTQIGTLIKHEVDEYYQQLSFVKKIFVSRDAIHREVDDMVNSTLPRRVEEFLRGEAFAEEAERFLDSTIDNLLSRPIRDIVGQIAPDKLDLIKSQIAERILALAQSPDLAASVSAYTTDALHRIKPHSLRAVLEHASPNSGARLRNFLAKGLLDVLSRDETARTINAILSAQIERLLVMPIGRLADHVTEEFVRNAGTALTLRITAAARERLPAAISEFDVGSIVRNKISEYPVKKLEVLVLSVAQQHLRTIELFGAFIGLVIGIAQAVYLWWKLYR